MTNFEKNLEMLGYMVENGYPMDADEMTVAASEMDPADVWEWVNEWIEG